MCASTELDLGDIALEALNRVFGPQPWPGDVRMVRPTDPFPFIRPGEGRFELLEGRWGLLSPSLVKDDAHKAATFNARAETVLDKPTFRDAFRSGQRCVLIASAYHEWPLSAGVKTKVRISRGDGLPLFFAGLWNEVETQRGKTMTCTMLTRPPIRGMVEVHDRFPALLITRDLEGWLHGSPAQAREIALTSWPERNLQVVQA